MATVSTTTGVVTAKSTTLLIGKTIGVIATTKALGIDGAPLASETYQLSIYTCTTQVTTNCGTRKANITTDLYKGKLQLSAACQPIDSAL